MVALVSASLNCRSSPHSSTTGNSSPLDLWMDRMRTPPASSPATGTATPLSAIRARWSRKAISPRCPLASNRQASS